MRALVLSLGVLPALLVTAPVWAQTVHPGPGKVVTGPPTLPSVEPLSHQASNLPGMQIRSTIAPALPSVDLGANATAGDYLRAARQALASGNTGRAQAALENAETLLLTRSVPYGTNNRPDQSPAIRNVDAALRSLAAHDIQSAMNLTGKAIATAGHAVGQSAASGA